MDYFCQQCSAKPGWPWDETNGKFFHHACQRCFQYKPVQDFAWKTGRKKIDVAPKPNEIVSKNVAEHAECKLPPAKGTTPVPVPVYPVANPNQKNEVDMAIDAVQPNRPGIKMEVKRK